MINIEKSGFTYSPNLDCHMIAIFKNLLGMSSVKQYSKYLGMPFVVGGNQMETFKGFEEKMSRRVQDWKNKLLSWTGMKYLSNHFYNLYLYLQ